MNSAAFGFPVVPDVDRMQATSSECAGLGPVKGATDLKIFESVAAFSSCAGWTLSKSSNARKEGTRSLNFWNCSS